MNAKIFAAAASRSIGSVARAWLFVMLAGIVAGCGAKRFEYHSATEIPEGPGMLTGNEGAVVIYRNNGEGQPPAAEPHSAPKSGTEGSVVKLRGPEGDREFREFQEFKRWKEANRDSPEYREFREWQEWKAFRAWKKKHAQ